MLPLPASIRRLSLSQQLALVASLCCLVASLALVALAARSSAYTQADLQQEYGRAVAQTLATRLAAELASEDLLGVAAELQQLTDQPSIAGARALDVDGLVLVESGSIADGNSFRTPILITGDVAGEAEVFVDSSKQDAARWSFLLGLSGLAVILSAVVYGVTRPMGHRLARNIDAITAELATVANGDPDATNEVERLRAQVASLPLDLLRPQASHGGSDQHYDRTAVLFLHLRSLPGYIDTLDERRLQSYIKLIHRVIFGAAGFYDGELQVVRQYGLAVFFSGQHRIGSPVLRAASCAWLVQQSSAPIEEQLRLKLQLGMAVGTSELGKGDDGDIYPGLYTQAALDELQGLATTHRDGVLVTAEAANDVDLTTRVELDTLGDDERVLGKLADGHRDLLERQLQILLKAVVGAKSPSAEDAEA